MELIILQILTIIFCFIGLISGIALYRLTKEEIEIIKPYIKWSEILLIAILSFINIYYNVIIGIGILIFLILYNFYKDKLKLIPFYMIVIFLSFNKEILFINGFLIFCILIIRGTYMDYENKKLKNILPF